MCIKIIFDAIPFTCCAISLLQQNEEQVILATTISHKPVESFINTPSFRQFYLFLFFKLIVLFGKDELNLSDLIVNNFYISNKCCSFEPSI